MYKIILQVLHKVCVCTTYSPISSLLKNEWETCKFLVWQNEIKQAYARSILTAFNPTSIWLSFWSNVQPLLSCATCFIADGNCFNFCWSHCFLGHGQTDWTESKQNYFLSLKIGNVWIAFPVRTLPTLHLPVFMCSPHPYSVGFSEVCSVSYGERRWWSAARVSSPEQNS